MHINNPDALRNWLTVILEPLCDADPAALARYVLALLKKEKPAKELKQCMQEQLDVFLGQETSPFLERLFDAIKSEEYLTHAASSSVDGVDVETLSIPTGSTDALLASSQSKSERECTPPLSDNKTKEFDSLSLSPLSSIQSTSGGGASQSTVTSATTTPHTTHHHTRNGSPSKIKEESHSSSNSSRDIGRRRNRSRSRSFERSTKRSRSKERRNVEHNRERNVHKYRNKSPPQNQRRFERRGGNSGGNFRRNRSQSGSRSRSVSPERKKPSRSISPNMAIEHEMHPKKRQRCRDFDEKGYCMRGETCPWDHGVDPVVLEDINNPALLSIQQNAPLRGGPVHPEYSPYAPDLWNRGMRPNGPGGMNNPGFGRLPPGARPPTGAFPFPLNPTPLQPQSQQQLQQQQQRELIPVPVVDGGNAGGASGDLLQTAQLPPHIKRRFEQDETSAPGMNEGPNKRKPPIQNRLGPRVSAQQNCSLELRKIPRGLNAISHLNNHFSKFGKIVNMQVCYDGDPEAAIVTFSTHAEANVAYRSTEAVLNNRFIKVFWHSAPAAGTANGEQGAAPQGGAPKPDPSSFRKNNYPNQYHINHKTGVTTTSAENVTSNTTTSTTTQASTTTTASTETSTVDVKSGTITTTTATGGTQSISNKGMTLVNTAAGATPPVVAPVRIPNPKLKREVAQLARKQKENAVQVACGLMKKKQTLLEGYLKQMQSTVGLLERSDVTDEQKKTYIATIKELDAKIVALRKEIAAEQQRLAAVQPPIQDGNDTTAIQRKLKELQKSIHTAKSRIRSGPPKIAPPGSTSVDRRPTTICVTGFELDESDIILGHFKHFGEITKNELDKSVPSLTISYATRLNAEQAMQRGRFFKEKQMQLSWVTTNGALSTKQQAAVVAASEPNNVVEQQQEQQVMVTSVGIDDDEDEQEEERSWRR
ncbi:zinc finger protein swm isoform X2 [Culicoides brevitarsis]|uniref:zinc finger protein swm isoform X2 n=1 Tax=Culicoides brevitarsis TaxID=469753 RepID=UPI00307B7B9F